MSHPSNHDGRENYEKTDIWPGVVWISLIALAFFIVAGIVISYASYAGLEFWFKRGDKKLSPMIQTEVVPPAPRLQVTPAADLADFKETQQEPLQHYAWINRESGKARIPVARAMQLLVESQGIQEQQEETVEP